MTENIFLETDNFDKLKLNVPQRSKTLLFYFFEITAWDHEMPIRKVYFSTFYPNGFAKY